MITKANNTVLDLVSPSIDALDMGGNRITNVGSPILGTDAASRDFVLGQSFLPLSGGTMSGSILMGSNRVIDLGDPIGIGDAVSLGFAQANFAAQGYLNDPTITRDSNDSFTVGVFQASPLAAVTPFATTTSSITRQLTNLFLRTIAGLSGVVENQGSFAVPPLTTQSDISFGTGPDRITAGSGTPFSTFNGAGGDKVIVSGSASNDGIYDVSAATATTIDTVQALTIEALGASVSIFRVAQSTSYHLFAVLETGVGTIDIAVDDNVSGSNIGTGVSAGWEVVRRLWSFKLDASTDIQSGIKYGDRWYYDNPGIDASFPSSPTLTTINVPTGFRVEAQVELAMGASNSNLAGVVDPGDLTGRSASTGFSGPAVLLSDLQFAAGGNSTAGHTVVLTNTSGQIFADRDSADASSIRTYAYRDQRID